MKTLRNVIIIVVCVVIIIVGLVLLINRRPEVAVGTVRIVVDDTSATLEGHKIKSVYDGKTNNYTSPSFQEISKKELPIFNYTKQLIEQDVVNDVTTSFSDTTDGNYYIPTKSGVTFTGTHLDILYNIYDISGTLLNSDTKINIPVEKLGDSPREEVIVEVSVQWGRTNNYIQYNYYFRCIIE
jgi:uncharacterized protein YxeA